MIADVSSVGLPQARGSGDLRGLAAPAPLPDLMRRLNRVVLFHLIFAHPWS